MFGNKVSMSIFICLYYNLNVRNILGKIKIIFIQPRFFFRKNKNEKGIKSAFIYYFVILLVPFVIGTILLIISSGSFKLKTDSPIPFLTGPFIPVSFLSIIISFIIYLLLPFIVVGVVHLWIKIWGGKGGYSKTYQLYVYANTPKIILESIPIIGLIG